MSDDHDAGVLQRMKEGGIYGATVGFTVAAARSFLFGRDVDLQEHADKVKAQRALPTSAVTKPLPSAPSASVVRTNVFKRVMRTTSGYAGIGVVFMGTEAILRTSRDEDDVWNKIIAAATAGSFVGVRAGNFFVSAGAAAAMAGGVAFHHVFHSLGPYDPDHFKKRLRLIYRE